MSDLILMRQALEDAAMNSNVFYELEKANAENYHIEDSETMTDVEFFETAEAMLSKEENKNKRRTMACGYFSQRISENILKEVEKELENFADYRDI